jgi:hypothetical protein
MKQADAIERTPSAIKTKAPATKQRQYQTLVPILVGFLEIMEAAGSYGCMSRTIGTALR